MDEAAGARIWLISGVGSGLGRAIAAVALACGDRVGGIVRSGDGARAFDAIAPGRSLGIVADVAGPDAGVAAVRACREAFGLVDILVNNAGRVLEATVEEVEPEAALALLQVNLLGALRLTQAVLPDMRARRCGRILNISSGGGMVGLPALGLYCASKFALEGLSEALAAEVEGLGIHVTIVEPGSFRTGLLVNGTSRVPTVIADYEEACGAWRRRLGKMAGAEPNDPARLADAIIRLVDHPQPPRRLPLGADAIAMIETKLADIARDIAPWRALGQDMGFPNAEFAVTSR